MPDIADLQRLAEEFDVLCQVRHDEGSKEYGPLAFLKNDMFVFAYEELADLANYTRFLFIKLRLLEEYLNESGLDMSSVTAEEIRNAYSVSHGTSAFSPSEKVSGFFPNKK